jgi:hypothetical protein
VILSGSLLACGEPPPRPPTISVDPRIELIGVIQYLSGYTLRTRGDFAYVHDVEEHFRDFNDHEAVTLFRDMSDQGFTFDVVPRTLLSLSGPPELREQAGFSNDIVLKAGGEANLARWLESLRLFARESRFMDFFETHQAFYDSVVANTTPAWEAAVDTMEAYLGTELTDVNLVLANLFHRGGFSTLLGRRRHPVAVAVIGPLGTEHDLPVFGDPPRIGRMVWQSFFEPTVSRLTHEHRDWLAATDSLYEPISDDMNALGIQTWEQTVNEHIVRALMIRFATHQLGPGVGRTAFQAESRRGFRYLPAVWNELNQYELHRDEYPTLADFYPRLLEVMVEGVRVVSPTDR